MNRSQFIACLLGLSAISAGAVSIPGGSGSFPKVRWCVPLGAGPDCLTLLQLIPVNVNLAGIFIATFDDIVTCVEYENCDAADGPLTQGLAEIGSDIDGGPLFALSEVLNNITMLVSEDEGDVVGEPAEIRGYYGLPIVPRGSQLCDAPTIAEALEGVRTCHTGYLRTAGWRIPVGTLSDEGILPNVCDFCNGNNAAGSLAAFVDSSCAPGAGDLTPYNETLCANCRAENPGDDPCASNSIYSGYQGALRCLVEDAGDVAFIRQTTVDTYADEITVWSEGASNSSDYVALCRQGGCSEISDFESCAWAQTVFHTTILVFTNPQPEMIEILRNGFDTASSIPAVQEYFTGGLKEGVLFDSGTTKLVRIDDPIEEYAEELFAAFEGLEAVDDGSECTKYKWCVAPGAEAACMEMLEIAELDGIIECFTSSDCQSVDGPMITGEADLTSNVDGGPFFELFEAGNIQPLASEDEGDVLGEEAAIRGYYAVAAVPVGSPLCAAANLGEAVQGARTCHTGYGRTAGWRIPVGTLLDSFGLPPIIDNDLPNDLVSLEGFVSSACVPGAEPTEEFADSLCSNCIGEGEAFCSNSDDPYQDYEGGFRCLVDGNGDVAFIRQSTIPLFSGPNTDPSWGVGEINATNYQLLCRQGGCTTLDDFENCFLAQTVFHSVAMRPCIDQEDVEFIQQKLMNASSNPMFWKFFKGGSEAGVIFEDGTTKLLPVTVDSAAYGGLLFDAFAGLEALNEITCDLCGDVSNDGVVNVQDLVRLSNFILGTDPVIGCINEVGDANADGSITIQDIVAIANILLGIVDSADLC